MSSWQITARGIPHLEEDGRLLPMLNNLSKQYLGQDYSNSKRSGNSAINLEDIEKVLIQAGFILGVTLYLRGSRNYSCHIFSARNYFKTSLRILD